MAKKKSDPAIDIKITGDKQAATINKVFVDKLTADDAKKDYDKSRTDGIPLMTSKVLGYWAKVKEIVSGSFNFVLPDGTVRNVTVQNRQSSKSFDPKDAIKMLADLNANTKDDAKLKAGDVFDVVIDHGINHVAMGKKAVRERILATLTSLEATMKAEGSLEPEVSLVVETKTLKLAEHALSRLLALSQDFETSMKIIDSPVTLNMITKVQAEE